MCKHHLCTTHLHLFLAFSIERMVQELAIYDYEKVRARWVFDAHIGVFQSRLNCCACLWWTHDLERDDFWRSRCRQMAGLKSLPQSTTIRHQKPLGAVASESLLLEGPYLLTKFHGYILKTLSSIKLIKRFGEGLSPDQKIWGNSLAKPKPLKNKKHKLSPSRK